MTFRYQSAQARSGVGDWTRALSRNRRFHEVIGAVQDDRPAPEFLSQDH